MPSSSQPVAMAVITPGVFQVVALIVRSSGDPGTGLLDRRGERAALDRALGQARAGTSAVLVVRGEPGIGKTTFARRFLGEINDFTVVLGTAISPMTAAGSVR